MNDYDKELFTLYAACIAADKADDGKHDYDDLYDAAIKAKSQFFKRQEFDALLPDGVTYKRFYSAACDYFSHQCRPYYDRLAHRESFVISENVIDIYRALNWEPKTPDVLGRQNREQQFHEFLDYYLTKEHVRELYDYMHEMKLIDF